MNDHKPCSSYRLKHFVEVSVREIVIDDPLNGDRIVEIGAVELENVISFEVDALSLAVFWPTASWHHIYDKRV